MNHCSRRRGWSRSRSAILDSDRIFVPCPSAGKQEMARSKERATTRMTNATRAGDMIYRYHAWRSPGCDEVSSIWLEFLNRQRRTTAKANNRGLHKRRLDERFLHSSAGVIAGCRVGRLAHHRRLRHSLGELRTTATACLTRTSRPQSDPAAPPFALDRIQRRFPPPSRTQPRQQSPSGRPARPIRRYW